jgi:hypothetical protein
VLVNKKILTTVFSLEVIAALMPNDLGVSTHRTNPTVEFTVLSISYSRLKVPVENRHGCFIKIKCKLTF